MKCARTFAIGVLFLARCACAEPAAASGAGSNIVGDREAAIGLYLDPWREEPAGELKPPPHALPPLQAIDDATARRAAQIADEREAVRRARLQSH